MQVMPDARQQSFEEIYGSPENFLEIEPARRGGETRFRFAGQETFDPVWIGAIFRAANQRADDEPNHFVEKPIASESQTQNRSTLRYFDAVNGGVDITPWSLKIAPTLSSNTGVCGNAARNPFA